MGNLGWRTQGRGQGLGKLGDTSFAVVQCVGGMVVATSRATHLDPDDFERALALLEGVTRLAWRGPKPSSFHLIVEEDQRKAGRNRMLLAVGAVLLVGLAVVTVLANQQVPGNSFPVASVHSSAATSSEDEHAVRQRDHRSGLAGGMHPSRASSGNAGSYQRHGASVSRCSGRG